MIHRVNLRNDVISIFSDKDIFKYDLDVTFINQKGDLEEGKGQGVTREMLSSFWGEFYTSFSIGSKQKVPIIRHDFQSKEWEAVGRAFVFGLKYGFYFLDKVSTAFLTEYLFGENAITEVMLLHSYKAYVSSEEEEVIQKCLTDPSMDPSKCEDVLDFLSSFQCFKVPSKQKIRSTILELTHKELVQKPSYVADCWSRIFTIYKSMTPISNCDELNAISDKCSILPKKIIKLFQVTPSN